MGKRDGSQDYGKKDAGNDDEISAVEFISNSTASRCQQGHGENIDR